MPKPERKEVILRYFAKNEVMLTSGLAFQNLREYRQITFSRRTTVRILYELVDDDLMETVDRGGHNLYRITASGRKWLEEK